MADREFVFGNAEVRQLIVDRFIALAMDDFYLRRQDDDAGRFFRGVADQGPRKGEDGATRQGRYAFTASGKLLGYNNNREPARILAMLREALATFAGLPEEQRGSAATFAQAPGDGQFTRVPPREGAVIKVHTRVLESDATGVGLRRCTVDEAAQESFRHRGFGAAIDHLWLRKEDVAALQRAAAGTGKEQTFNLPEMIAVRIARFHLADNTRGEPPHWHRNEIRSLQLTGTRGADGDIRITGNVHLETPDASRGFIGKALGNVSTANGVLVKFDLVVLGDFWGEGRYTRGARPGKNPIGFAFELVPSPGAADRIPPQGSRWLEGYYQAER